MRSMVVRSRRRYQSPVLGSDTVIVGDRNSFAIESSITKAYPSLSQRALGYFVVHIRGKTYGVQEPDATALGCSFYEVCDRLERRGAHRVSYLPDVPAPLIVEAYLDAFYRDTARNDYFGRSWQAFFDDHCGSKASWAPDGDEAFDDGSYILQFDVGEKVRLIAFLNMGLSVETAESVEETWLESDIYYGVLAEWRDRFAAEWAERLSDENPEAGPA